MQYSKTATIHLYEHLYWSGFTCFTYPDCIEDTPAYYAWTVIDYI